MVTNKSLWGLQWQVIVVFYQTLEIGKVLNKMNWINKPSSASLMLDFWRIKSNVWLLFVLFCFCCAECHRRSHRDVPRAPHVGWLHCCSWSQGKKRELNHTQLLIIFDQVILRGRKSARGSVFILITLISAHFKYLFIIFILQNKSQKLFFYCLFIRERSAQWVAPHIIFIYLLYIYYILYYGGF